MQVKIRSRKRWPEGYTYEWQPIPNYKNRWYGLYTKNIQFQKLSGEARREASSEVRNVMNALYQGLIVIARAQYDRGSHTLILLEKKGTVKMND